MDKDTLNNILQQHKDWLHGEGGKRADFRCVDLQGISMQGADLRNASIQSSNLRGTDISFTDLRGADMTGTVLTCSNLQGANLQGANLSFTDIRGADLTGANLSCANLQAANLRGSNLQRANLRGTDLKSADFQRADLQFADLQGAIIKGTNLSCANLQCAKDVPYIPMSCPDEGAFIAWKKAFYSADVDGCNIDEYLVKLLIPEDARRLSATGRKCRSDKAVVLSIEPIVRVSVIPNEVYSRYDPSFAYKVGQTIVVPDFDTDRFNECASGIHFFINRQEAIDY